MKINRLLEIIIILLNKETVTARELAEKFGVSSRTIYRDIDVLSSSGIPVYTNKGSGGGISLLEHYTLNKTLVSENERESLVLALKMLQTTGYPEFAKVLQKLGSIFKELEPDDWMEVNFSPWGINPDRFHKFDDIKRAILEHRIMEFDYVNARNQRNNRKVAPLKLFFRGQSWYLWGYCTGKEDFRIFKISRIKKQKVSGEFFERKNLLQKQEDKKKMDWSDQELNFVDLKLRFRPEVLYRLYDEYDDEYLVPQNDGTYEVNVSFPEDEWVYNYIMSFSSNVEVIEPEHVRKIIKDRIKKTMEIYEK